MGSIKEFFRRQPSPYTPIIIAKQHVPDVLYAEFDVKIEAGIESRYLFDTSRLQCL